MAVALIRYYGMSDIKPIVIIGNGPSIRNFDYDRLGGIDTMAMNAFFKVRDFTPSYYCFLRYYDFWGNEPIEYIVSNSYKMKGCFFVKRAYGGRIGFEHLETFPNVVPILRSDAPTEVPEKLKDLKFSPIYKEELSLALDEISKGRDDSEVSSLLEEIGEDPPYYLNKNGMVKWFVGGDISESDVITNIRWDPSFAMSDSLSDFYSSGEPAGVECVRIASILGYNVVILIGFDGGFKTNDKGDVLPESWGIDNPFNGTAYNAYEITKCELCRTGEGIDMRNESYWSNLLAAIEMNGVRMQIYNCTPDSKIKVLEKADLDDIVRQCSKWI